MEKLRIGIADLSSDHVWWMGTAMQAQSDAEVVAIADVHDTLRTKGAKAFGVGRVYCDYTEMLDTEGLDGLIVCGDNASKPDVVEQAAARGVGVCLDKPMAADLAGADRVIAAAEAAGIVVMTAYHFMFGEAYQAARQWVQDGRIGQVYLVRASIGHAGPREINLSEYFAEWLIDPKRNGGGAFADEACYMVSMFTDFLGPIAEISTYMTQQGWRDYLPADSEDNSVAILRFESGALGVIDSKWGQIGQMPYARSLHGNKGTLMMGRNNLRVYSQVEHQGPEPTWEDHTFQSGGRGVQEAAFFVACLRGTAVLTGPVGLAGARHTQEVIEAGYISAREGRSIKLPL